MPQAIMGGRSMPAAAEREIRARGGAVRWRRVTVRGRTLLVAVVRKKGPNGGRVVLVKRGK